MDWNTLTTTLDPLQKGLTVDSEELATLDKDVPIICEYGKKSPALSFSAFSKVY